MKHEKGAVEVFLSRDFFDSLITVLSSFIQADAENMYGIYAARLKDKIMKYSRCFTHQGEENAVVYFYAEEAGILIKLLTIYSNAVQPVTDQYYSQLYKNKSTPSTGQKKSK